MGGVDPPMGRDLLTLDSLEMLVYERGHVRQTFACPQQLTSASAAGSIQNTCYPFPVGGPS